MIGQTNLQNKIQDLIDNEKFPQFAVFIGDDGSGKKTLMNLVANNWRFSYTCDDVKVDTIRKMIDFCYQTASTEKCVYIIPDAQKMSLKARNAILKIVEEPPKNSTFLMSVNSEQNMLDTIRSRGQIFRMESYLKSDFEEFFTKHQDASGRDYIISIANNIADCEKLLRIDLDAFRKHINIIIDKADSLSMGNLLKSSQQIALKDEEDKFELKIYLQAFQQECLERMDGSNDIECLRDMIIETSSRLNDLRVTGINKQMTYENWLLNIRDIKERYGDS